MDDDEDGDLMTVEEFQNACANGSFIDYDGFGDMIVDGKAVGEISPSSYMDIPSNVTHVRWYNR